MRIAIVNDILLAVEAMRRVLDTSEHELAWIASDGTEAVERCAVDPPDLILMDLIMPRMDGVEATRRIMAGSPCAILVVTANVNENSSRVFEAMGAGALDAVNTPVLECPTSVEGVQALRKKIETIRKLIGASGGRRLSALPPPGERFPARRHDPLVVVGASAGGPAALAKLLSQLPPEFSAPVIIIQHVDAQFARGLAEWLDGKTPLRVRVAGEGDRPVPGEVLFAGQDAHLVFAGPTRLSYTSDPPGCTYRPSIDVFFKSAERFWPGDVIGVLLTGMGRDGAEGLRALYDTGHHTIAQDSETSVVYGMPKAAVDLNAVSEILPLDKIAPRLASLLAQKLSVHG